MVSTVTQPRESAAIPPRAECAVQILRGLKFSDLHEGGRFESAAQRGDVEVERELHLLIEKIRQMKGKRMRALRKQPGFTRKDAKRIGDQFDHIVKVVRKADIQTVTALCELHGGLIVKGVL